MTWQQNTVFYQITLFIEGQLRLIRPMDIARLSPGKRSAARQNSALLSTPPQQREQTHATVT